MRKNLRGQRFGRLLVLEDYKVLKGRVEWLCRCDCGREKYVRYINLFNNHTSSCGCLRKQLTVIKNKSRIPRLQKESPRWTGVGDLSGCLLVQIKRSAAVRNLEFNVTAEEMWDLFQKQEGKCALTGLSLTFDSKSKKRDGSASLDRIDSGKGYTIDNVQWVHKDINVMKQDFSETYFIELCRLVIGKYDDTL